VGCWALWPCAPALGVALVPRRQLRRACGSYVLSELDRAVSAAVEMIQKRGVAATEPQGVGRVNQVSARWAGEARGRRGTHPGTLSAGRGLEDAAVVAATSVRRHRRLAPPRSSASVADGEFKTADEWPVLGELGRPASTIVARGAPVWALKDRRICLETGS